MVEIDVERLFPHREQHPPITNLCPWWERPSAKPTESSLFCFKDNRTFEEDPVKSALQMAEDLDRTNPKRASDYFEYAINHERLLREGEGTWVIISEGEIIGERFTTGIEAANHGYSTVGTTKDIFITQVVRKRRPLQGTKVR